MTRRAAVDLARTHRDGDAVDTKICNCRALRDISMSRPAISAGRDVRIGDLAPRWAVERSSTKTRPARRTLDQNDASQSSEIRSRTRSARSLDSCHRCRRGRVAGWRRTATMRRTHANDDRGHRCAMLCAPCITARGPKALSRSPRFPRRDRRGRRPAALLWPGADRYISLPGFRMGPAGQ